MSKERFKLGPFEFQSRLFVGTGKYADFDQMNACLEACGAEVVTVAIREMFSVFWKGRYKKNGSGLIRYILRGCWQVLRT